MHGPRKLEPYKRLDFISLYTDQVTRLISSIIAWLKFLYGLLPIFPLILFVYGTQSPFSICPYKTFLVLDRNNGP